MLTNDQNLIDLDIESFRIAIKNDFGLSISSVENTTHGLL